MSASAPAADSISPKASIWMSAIISSVGTALLGLIGAAALWSYQTHRTERAAEVTKFIENAQQFDRSVTEFMGPFLKGQNDLAKRDALHKNIQDQFLALERASNSLEGVDAQRATRYRDALVAVGTELDRGEKAADAKELVQAIATAREAGICVTYVLRETVDMDTSAEDAAYCAK